jgi:N-acetylneuraminate synthase
MSIFDDLFVLELANNHWGRLDRGLKIIEDFGLVARTNGVHAAMKLQFRDVPTFIHDQHATRQDMRYLSKVAATELSWPELGALVDAVRDNGMRTMATPFDEVSVDKCLEFDVEFLKIASSDIRDRILVEKMASTGRPVIASSGGSSLEHLDDLVEFFKGRGIPFALNHCVSIYPSEDGELELNQIDFLRSRYPGTTIGFSSHEMTDWRSSMLVAYAKGARTFERHVDIDFEGVPVSPYCTLPHQADTWFKAYYKAREMCGQPGAVKRTPPEKEIRYLDQLVRGVYAKRNLPRGHLLTKDDVFFAIPLLHGQISTREFSTGERLRADLNRNDPVLIREIACSYADDLTIQRALETRGVSPLAPGIAEALLRVSSV